jgi:hypothetical protein
MRGREPGRAVHNLFTNKIKKPIDFSFGLWYNNNVRKRGKPNERL